MLKINKISLIVLACLYINPIISMENLSSKKRKGPATKISFAKKSNKALKASNNDQATTLEKQIEEINAFIKTINFTQISRTDSPFINNTSALQTSASSTETDLYEQIAQTIIPYYHSGGAVKGSVTTQLEPKTTFKGRSPEQLTSNIKKALTSGVSLKKNTEQDLKELIDNLIKPLLESNKSYSGFKQLLGALLINKELLTTDFKKELLTQPLKRNFHIFVMKELTPPLSYDELHSQKINDITLAPSINEPKSKERIWSAAWSGTEIGKPQEINQLCLNITNAAFPIHKARIALYEGIASGIKFLLQKNDNGALTFPLSSEHIATIDTRIGESTTHETACIYGLLTSANFFLKNNEDISPLNKSRALKFFFDYFKFPHNNMKMEDFIKLKAKKQLTVDDFKKEFFAYPLLPTPENNEIAVDPAAQYDSPSIQAVDLSPHHTTVAQSHQPIADAQRPLSVMDISAIIN